MCETETSLSVSPLFDHFPVTLGALTFVPKLVTAMNLSLSTLSFFLVYLRVLDLKRSTGGALSIPFYAKKKYDKSYMTNIYTRNSQLHNKREQIHLMYWYLKGVKHFHLQNRIFLPLRCSFHPPPRSIGDRA